MASANGSGLVSIGKAANRIGVSPQTIRNYVQQGKLRTARVKGGWRRFKISDLENLLGEKNEDSEGAETQKILAYVRSSSHSAAQGFNQGNEDNELGNQKKRVIEFCESNYNCPPLIFSDIGSGLSYTRKGFVRLIREILAGEHNNSILLIHNKERIVRFGYELVEMICNAHGVKLIIIDRDSEVTDSQELAEDLLAIIHVFSSRSYALRAAKRNRKEVTEDVKDRILALRKECSFARTSRIANEQGLRTKDGCAISIQLVRRVCAESMEWTQSPSKTSPLKNDAIKLFLDENISFGADSLRVEKLDLYGAYKEWATKNGHGIETINLFSRLCKKYGLKDIKFWNKESQKSVISFKGILLKGDNSILKRVSLKSPPPPLKQLSNSESNNFILFYKNELKGRFPKGITRTDINLLYKKWLNENNEKPVRMSEIPKLILDLSGSFAVRKGDNMVYML